MRRKRKQKDLIGYLLIGACFTLLCGAATAFALLRPPPTDPKTLCRTDAPLSAYTIILVDATDKLEPRHKKRLDAVIRQERARLATYDRLAILALRPDKPQEPRLLFNLCLPRDAASANPLFENPALAQKRWDAQVGALLKAAERRAGGGKPAQASPILEALNAAVADPDFLAAAKRRVVLVSDLLEHVPGGFSLYRPGADYAAYRASHPDAAAALAGVSVRIAPLDRPEDAARQDDAKRLFWTPYFAASGAMPPVWDPIG